ncbi:MAG: hypothetical protein QOF85_515 [Solirubrobacterales bacterium]|nr:hypothetical protein [Solirubrobacterales bacterium]
MRSATSASISSHIRQSWRKPPALSGDHRAEGTTGPIPALARSLKQAEGEGEVEGPQTFVFSLWVEASQLRPDVLP